MSEPHWMHQAIAVARAGIGAGQTPFGAVIVRGDVLVASGHNEVWLRGDPTAHAEVVAIQRAAAATGSIDLGGCAIYTTCEPCPMCAAAIHWAKLGTAFCGASIADARGAGFSELGLPAAELYELGGSRVRIVAGVLRDDCAALFQEWRSRGASAAY